jgi:tetratricopeptide (TPR) repeat protein
MSELLIKEARVDEAQRSLEAAVSQQPWSPSLHQGLSDLKLKIGLRNGQERLIREAHEGYERVLSLNPGAHQARLQRARSAIKLGDPQQALRDLTLLSSEPAFRDTLDFELGEAKMALKRDEEAQAHFKTVLARHPQHLEAHRAMGQLHARAQRDAQAKDSFEQALALNPRDPTTRYELGRLSLKTGEAKAAVEHLRVTATAKLQDPDAQYWFARALEATEEPQSVEEALSVYEGAARLLRERSSDTPKPLCDVHFRVGRLHARSARQLNLALEDFTRASQCDPSRADIWTELASQYERLGDQKRASGFYQDALKRDRGFAPALVGLARDALRARPTQRKRAERYLKRALKRDPKLAEAHYQLCKLYQGSRAKARAACKAYLRVSPEGKFAREVKEILQAL